MEVTKIYDVGCHVCKAMGKFDAQEIDTFQEVKKYQQLPLDDLMTIPGYANLYQYTERYAINDDYTLDLPVYLVTDKGKYRGYCNGELTRTEFKSRLQSIILGEEDP